MWVIEWRLVTCPRLSHQNQSDGVKYKDSHTGRNAGPYVLLKQRTLAKTAKNGILWGNIGNVLMTL
jgi:hypothetical protein